MTDLYTVLGVKPSATQDDIKRAYRRLAVRYHPDVSQEDDCEQRFAAVNHAYQVLSDPVERASYDIRRQTPAPRYAAAAGAAADDPFADLLRRHRAEAHRRAAASSQDADWAERMAYWEQEKADAAAYKERSQRLHTRMHQAHSHRIAKALSMHWQTHSGVTRQDVAAATLLASGCAALVWVWACALGEPAGGGARSEEPEPSAVA